MIVILGAGLAGLSASYHIGHDRCVLLERNLHAFGHIHSSKRDGFTWDQGPHVSFTKHDYVRQLFSDNVDLKFEDFEVQVGNYFHGNWITHPAQTSLYQVPEPTRKECLDSFLTTRAEPSDAVRVENYMHWLEKAFGPVFARTFPKVYTTKYWTRPPADLAIDWIGDRVLYPSIEDVVRGANGPLGKSTHYINRVRYPNNGGFESFAHKLCAGANVHYGAEVIKIDLKSRILYLSNGQSYAYDKLVNTLPLPIFINACNNVPSRVTEAVRHLSCSQLLIVNIAVPHNARRPEHWIYVYDFDKLATRINFTEKLSQKNAPEGWTGIQVEVYFSRYRPLPAAPEIIAEQVEQELIEMGLIVPDQFISGMQSHRHYSYSPWANVIFDHGTAPALSTIWSWLEGYGLIREEDDTHPLTNWESNSFPRQELGKLFMAGRFAQWKYFWTDDCVLRGRNISKVL